MIVLFDGPDGCGKTQISRAVSLALRIPYFKVSTERKNWKADTFKNSLWFDYVLPQFIEATGVSFVSDRSYISEWAYPRVFNRQTDWQILRETDDQFAELGAIVVIPLRRDYSQNEKDDLVPHARLYDLHNVYQEFPAWTKCQTITIYVDDFNNDLSAQIPVLVESIKELTEHRNLRHVTLGAK